MLCVLSAGRRDPLSQQANTKMVIAAVVALIVLIGFLAWRTFGNQAPTADIETIKARQSKKANE